MSKRRIHSREKGFFLRYTLMFLCIAIAWVIPFLMYGKSMLNGIDGYYQHYAALLDMREYFEDFLSGEGWKMVDFSLGQGLDVLTTLSYYCLTEPLGILIALLFSAETMEIGYAVLLFSRFYLAGLFACMFSGRWIKEGWSKAIAGVVYAFCGFAAQGGMKHLNFGIGMVYLPLLLYAIDRVIDKRKYGLYIVSVALMLVSNYYFAFMNTVIAILYIVVVLVYKLAVARENVADCAKLGTGLLGGFLLGAALSAAVFLPVAWAFLSNGRLGIDTGYSGSMLHYPLWYYSKAVFGYFLPKGKVGFWMIVGITPLMFYGVAQLFLERKKDAGRILVMLCLCLVMGCLPIAGKIMNGTAYVTNRWCYAIALFTAVAGSVSLPALADPGNIRKVWIISALGIVYVLAALVMLRDVLALLALAVFGGIGAFLVFNCKMNGRFPARYFKTVISIIAVVSLSLYGMSAFLTEGQDVPIAQYADKDVHKKDAVHQMRVFENSNKDGFYRVSDSIDFENGHQNHLDSRAVMFDYNGMVFYWSIIPERMSSYYMDLWANRLEKTYQLISIGGGSDMNTLASVKYHLKSETARDVTPYGFEESRKVTLENGLTYDVLENKYALPLGYTYDTFMTETSYGELSSIKRRDALLQCAVVQEIPEGMRQSTPEEMIQQADFKLLIGGIEQPVDSYLTDETEIVCEIPEKSEVYLVFENMRDDYNSNGGFIVHGEAGLNFADIVNPASNFGYPQEGAVVYMGVHEAGEQRFRFEVGTNVRGHCADIRVYYRPVADYEAVVEKLGENVMENVKVSANHITGQISLDQAKWLQLSIPYNTGWTATVDGVAAEIAPSGGMYMGMMLEPGDHEIELNYFTPLLKEGIAISLMALAFCGVLSVAGRVRRKKQNIE